MLNTSPGLTYIIIGLCIVCFTLGLVIYPALYAFRSIGVNNEYLVEIKISIFGLSFSYMLFNPIWNYERLKNNHNKDNPP